MIVAIHQPNYFPWLGYFAKMARCDIFIFLTDAQFPKGSYVNRVKIADNAESWLTQPVAVKLGDLISSVEFARADWATAHRDKLFNTYRKASAFSRTFPEIEDWLKQTNRHSRLASANRLLVHRVAEKLKINCRFADSAELGISQKLSDERLAEIVFRVSPGGCYLSGKGGAKYQSSDVFAKKGLSLTYSSFQAVPYPRGDHHPILGLSILDVVFHHGWEAVGEMIRLEPGGATSRRSHHGTKAR